MATPEQNCKIRHNRYQTPVSSHKVGINVLYMCCPWKPYIWKHVRIRKTTKLV